MDKAGVIANNLSYRYGNFTAVHNFNLRVAPGEVVAIVGANGAGKSTLMKMLCGIYTPFEGEIYLGGFNMATQGRECRRVLGYMSQSSALIHHLTAIENLNYYGVINAISKKELKERYNWLNSRFNLDKFEDKRVESLTSGWKRIVAFSIATIASPSILLLDEPTAGIDTLTRRCIWSSIREMAQEGCSVVVTSHSLSEVALCDRRVDMARPFL